MTREDAIDLAIDEHDCKYAEEFVDKIFNDHEAVIKAKDDEIEILKSHLKTIDEDYSSVVNDFESAVMEIERLKDDLARRQDLLNMPSDIYNKWAKIKDTK